MDRRGRHLWGCRAGKYLAVCILGVFLMFLSGCMAVPAQDASFDLSEICACFEQAIAEGKMEAAFTTSVEYTVKQLYQQLEKAAQNQQMLYTGGCTYQVQTSSRQADYVFRFKKNSLVAVQRLDSTKAAYRAALCALRDCDYTTKYYSSTSYYPIFMLMLQQHPEYNYNTVVWKNRNGTYGYHRSSELTKAQQDSKMGQAEEKAEDFVEQKLKKGMAIVDKLKAAHDYLAKQCRYDYKLTDIEGYSDSLTAYGALVKKKAICQGYTAAFNLIAQKAGVVSIAICGTAGGGSHTWNYVASESGGRHIDCTWDATLLPGNKVCYDYFHIKRSEIEKDHVWDPAKYAGKHLEYSRYLVKPYMRNAGLQQR